MSSGLTVVGVLEVANNPPPPQLLLLSLLFNCCQLSSISSGNLVFLYLSWPYSLYIIYNYLNSFIYFVPLILFRVLVPEPVPGAFGVRQGTLWIFAMTTIHAPIHYMGNLDSPVHLYMDVFLDGGQKSLELS